ncbi:MAG: PhoB family transcriptional regulator [Bacilli bacterium]|nr:PhoB family transcriptional regulator [Bacilli bacterium]
MTLNLLIIEDEQKISRLLELELTYEGYTVELATTGREGLEKALSREWDLVLLDIMLPGLNGLEVLRRIRNTDLRTPIILITARDATPDKVSGLDFGANDYITKPFEIEEVLARIRSCLRKSSQMEHELEPKLQKILFINELTVNPITREVVRENTSIELTPKEFDLLVYLLENKNQVLTREQIINQVWGFDFLGDTNVVDVYVRYLRKKIDYPFKLQLIQTYRGVGYCIKEIK